MSKIIFQIDGGLGKSIMATAVIKAMKRKYKKDDIIVISSYPEVFLGNPNIFKCLSHDNLRYFYRDYVEGSTTTKFFLHNPYQHTDYLLRKSHLIQTWCSMFGIEYNGEMPELFLNSREIDFFSKQFISDKPIFILQTNGGGVDQQNKYSWSRDIPSQTAQEVVDEFKKDYNVLHIRREDQISLFDTFPLTSDFRSIATAIMMSQKRLFIDSFAQHTAKALGLDSVVCWIANTPKVFGYENNKNILANAETKKPEIITSVYEKYNITGDVIQFPYKSESEIFDADKIIDALNEK